jgi:putative hemolysin
MKKNEEAKKYCEDRGYEFKIVYQNSKNDK